MQKQLHICILLAQLRCDEKGFLAVCAFGLPGQTHDDGPAHGVLAALQIAHGMQASSRCLTLRSSVSVRRCIPVQSDARRTYICVALEHFNARRKLASVRQSVSRRVGYCARASARAAALSTPCSGTPSTWPPGAPCLVLVCKTLVFEA